MSETANLGLALLASGQAQKHVTVNEALSALDRLVHIAVRGRGGTMPPSAPQEHERHIVGGGAQGAWQGQDGALAAWQDGAWHFHAPRDGWLVLDVEQGALLAFEAGEWREVSGRDLDEIEQLGIGTQADAANPFAAKLNTALWTARETGEGGSGDLRYTMNKQGAQNVLSLLFQSGYGGRAEVGLIGEDDLVFKVSADGVVWREALRLEHATGAARFGAGLGARAFGGAMAAEPARPSLDLTFAPGIAPRAVRCRRPSRASRVDAAGRVRMADLDAPRHDHDPVNGRYLGLLVEEQRTNLLTRSQDLADAAWARSGLSVQSEATSAPDGTGSAAKLIEGDAIASQSLSRTLAGETGEAWTFSIWLKRDERSAVRLTLLSGETSDFLRAVFDLEAGSVLDSGGFGAAAIESAVIVAYRDGWFRCALSGRLGVGAHTPRCFVQLQETDDLSIGSGGAYAGDGNSGVYAWGAQLEAGRFATSYIPTVDMQATRAGDLLSVPTGDWFDPTRGTLYVEGRLPEGHTQAHAAIAFLRAGAVRGFCLRLLDGEFDASWRSDASYVRTLRPNEGGAFRVAASYSPSQAALLVNGGDPAFGTLAAAETLEAEQLMIGSGVVSGSESDQVALNGHITALAYFPRSLDAAVLRAMTERAGEHG